MPSLSEIREWSPAYLNDGADHWNRVAAGWDEVADDVHRSAISPGGTVWSGDGADAAVAHTTQMVARVREATTALRVMAKVANGGAEELQQAKSRVLSAVDEANADGFSVGEDFSVTDTQQVPPALVGERQALAAVHESTITAHVANMVTNDGEVASGIQAVDFKFGPMPQAPAPPPPNPLDPVNDFYRHIADQSNAEANMVPCPPLPVHEPSDWDKITTPGPGQSDADLQDAWAGYIGSVAGTTWGLLTAPVLGGVLGILTVKPSYDGLMKAYGMPQ